MNFKHLLAVPALLTGTLALAQNQSWTATDINGNTHSIADYIADGKTVLVDVSAHWCGPCWAWHNSGIMEKLYHEFGPEGTNDLVIFFVDGDAGSDMAQLQGGGDSQGDWIAGTPYPIIGPNGAGATLRQIYGVTAYPTLFMHCPGSNAGVEIDREATWEQFFASWRTACPAAFNNGAIDATLLTYEDHQRCPSEHPQAVLYNQGTSNLTSATVTLMQGANTLQTVNWTGNLARWASANITFDDVDVTAATDYDATVSSPNGGTDAHPEGDDEAYMYEPAPVATSATFNLELRTDNYGSETTWKLYNSANQVLYQDPAGNYANNTTYNYWWNLNPNECYRLEVLDSYGDGICCTYGTGFYKLRSNGVLVAEGGEFGAVAKEKAVAGASVGIGENTLEDGLSIFPNPTNDEVTIDFDLASASTVNITVTNMLGDVVMTAVKGYGSGAQQTTLSFGSLPSGSYILNILADGMTATRKVTVNK